MQTHVAYLEGENGLLLKCKLHAAAICESHFQQTHRTERLVDLRKIKAKQVALKPPVNSRTRPRSQVRSDTAWFLSTSDLDLELE